MLSASQFQSAHSAGSAHGSTAVCALQVLLVTSPRSSARSQAQTVENSGGSTASFVGLLSASASPCCANPCKALCSSDTRPKEEIWGVLFSVVPEALMNTRSTKGKNKITASTREQMLFAVMLGHLNTKFPGIAFWSRCFQVDDFTISILEKIKRNCTVSICNPPDVVSSYTLIIDFCGNIVEKLS